MQTAISVVDRFGFQLLLGEILLLRRRELFVFEELPLAFWENLAAITETHCCAYWNGVHDLSRRMWKEDVCFSVYR